MPKKVVAKNLPRVEGRPARGGALMNTAYVPNEADRIRVETAVFFGHPQKHICQLIVNPMTREPISIDTLTKYYHAELEAGAARTTQKLGEFLYRNAEQGDTKAAIFLLKSRQRWTDEREQRDPNIPPGSTELAPGVLLLPADAPDDEWEKMSQEHHKKIFAAEEADTE